LPSVDRVLRELRETDLPRATIVAVTRNVIDETRRELSAKSSPALDEAATVQRVRRALADLTKSRLQPVINATGVIVHTNLGRSPLGERVVRRLSEIARGYCNLEYDLGAGTRGNRGSYVEQSL